MMNRFTLALVLSVAAGAAQAQAAADIWKAKCKSCHGEDGRARTKMGAKEKIADMTQPAWQRASSDAEIRRDIAEGSPRNAKMKPFNDNLTPQQIDSLVAYIRTFKSK